MGYDGKRGNYMGVYPSFVSLTDITFTMNVLFILVRCRDVLAVLVSIHFLGSHTIDVKSVLTLSMINLCWRIWLNLAHYL